jgi:TRAP-type uncharacterized transport system substrate-binding protein
MHTETPPPDPVDAEPFGAWGLTARERLLGGAVLLGALVLAVALIVAVWRPAPPSTVVMSTGAEDGAYHAFGKRYQEILARAGVTLVLRPSAGAVENLERLRTRQDGVSLALVQGGLAQPGDGDRLVSLGAVAYEPLWLFHRGSLPLQRLSELRGRRVSGGVPGSGTHKVVVDLLEREGLAGMVPALSPLGGLQAAEALERGELDAVVLVSAPEGAAVQRLMRAADVGLLSMRRADAYVRQFPVLTKIEIPEGAADLARNLPPASTTLLSLKASLVATEDIHPVLVDLILDAAREVHGGGGLIRQPGEFPAGETAEFPMSADAERYYKSGPSVLRRYIPYWAAVWIQRLLFFGLPLLVIGIPLVRTMPILYRWSVRRRIFRWYGEMSYIERAAAQGRGQRAAQLERLGEIERRVNGLRIPPAFASEAYTLRMHVQQVRERLTAP